MHDGRSGVALPSCAARTQRAKGAAAAQQGGPNDAVDHSFQARGLYTPVEVRGARGRPLDGHESVLRNVLH
jgi:hypothetical protein